MIDCLVIVVQNIDLVIVEAAKFLFFFLTSWNCTSDTDDRTIYPKFACLHLFFCNSNVTIHIQELISSLFASEKLLQLGEQGLCYDSARLYFDLLNVRQRQFLHQVIRFRFDHLIEIESQDEFHWLKARSTALSIGRGSIALSQITFEVANLQNFVFNKKILFEKKQTFKIEVQNI